MKRNNMYRIVIVLIAVAIYGWQQRDITPTLTAAGEEPALATSEIDRARSKQRSDVIVTEGGTVTRVLADDNDGSRHQRFIVRLSTGTTVLVAHNIDLAPRVPNLREGDRVTMRGEYEWNEKGGVVHWTHHDPNGSHPGGWLEVDGKRYE